MSERKEYLKQTGRMAKEIAYLKRDLRVLVKLLMEYAAQGDTKAAGALLEIGYLAEKRKP